MWIQNYSVEQIYSVEHLINFSELWITFLNFAVENYFYLFRSCVIESRELLKTAHLVADNFHFFRQSVLFRHFYYQDYDAKYQNDNFPTEYLSKWLTFLDEILMAWIKLVVLRKTSLNIEMNHHEEDIFLQLWRIRNHRFNARSTDIYTRVQICSVNHSQCESKSTVWIITSTVWFIQFIFTEHRHLHSGPNLQCGLQQCESKTTVWITYTVWIS